MAVHSFDSSIAQQVGVNAAVLYQNISYWVEKNAANNKHFYDGCYWTYNAKSAFEELFPYLTSKQIRLSLDRLKEVGLIITGNYNEDPRDRTLWYSCPMHWPTKAAPLAPEGQCYKGTNSKHTDSKHTPIVPTGDETSQQPETKTADRFEDWWKVWPSARKQDKAKAKAVWQTHKLDAIADEIILKTEQRAHPTAGDLKWREAGGKYIPMPTTFLRGKRWQDEWHNPIGHLDIDALVRFWNEMAVSHERMCIASADEAVIDGLTATVSCLPDLLDQEDYKLYLTYISQKATTFTYAVTLSGCLKPAWLQKALLEMRGAA